MMMTFLLYLIAPGLICLFLAVLLVPRWIGIVPEGHSFVIERWGRYHATAAPGLLLIMPLRDRIRARVDQRERMHALKRNVFTTHDGERIRLQAVLFHRSVDPVKTAYGPERLTIALDVVINAALARAISRRTLELVLDSQHTIAAELMTQVHRVAGDWGIDALHVQIDEVRLLSVDGLGASQAQWRQQATAAIQRKRSGASFR